MAATDHDEDTIYASACSCSNLLDHILERAKNESKSLLLIEELRGRFNLWARYVGVFAARRASLDARLDPHPDIKDMVIELLDMLRRNLQWESESTPEASTNDASTTGSQSDETDIPDIARPGLSAAAAAIDRLIVLGASIRRSGRQSLRSRGFTASGGQEESLCCLLVRRRFPHAQKSLCDQIGASIHIRGTSLQYLKKHNDKLAYQRDAFGEPAAAIIGGEAGELQDQETNVFHDQKHRSQQAPTTVETLPSRVSASRVSRSKKPTASIISRGSTVQEAQETAFYYPPKPQPRLGEKYISCPICSEPLEKEELTKESWRAHVDRDLEPYVCLSEECKEPLRYFMRKREWAEHMQTRHTMTWTQQVHTEKWYCDIGHSDALEFDEKEPFLTHLKAEHGETLSKSQLQGRARRNRRVANRDPFICPLCDCVPEALVPYVSERPYKQLSEHIAQHLKSLAFLSLSYVQDSLDDVQGETESSRDDRTSTDARNSGDPQQHHDLESLGDIPETMITSDGKRRVDGLEFDNDGLPELGDPENWSFLPAKNLPTDFAVLEERLGYSKDRPPIRHRRPRAPVNEMAQQSVHPDGSTPLRTDMARGGPVITRGGRLNFQSTSFYVGYTLWKADRPLNKMPSWRHLEKDRMNLSQAGLHELVSNRAKELTIDAQYLQLSRVERSAVDYLVAELHETGPRFKWTCEYIKMTMNRDRTVSMDVILSRKLNIWDDNTSVPDAAVTRWDEHKVSIDEQGMSDEFQIASSSVDSNTQGAAFARQEESDDSREERDRDDRSKRINPAEHVRRTILLRIGDIPLEDSTYAIAILDTGTAANFMSEPTWERMNRFHVADLDGPSNTVLRPRLPMKVIGTARNITWNLSEGNETFVSDFHVVDSNSFDVIIGYNTIVRGDTGLLPPHRKQETVDESNPGVRREAMKSFWRIFRRRR